ncbi:MAG TPA: transglutaminase-like domain-containing protein [Thermoanaerobaculia bacterium]|nr:transglutaminase-like domain-containing protein [Thermoanaerobaculia bacterium]
MRPLTHPAVARRRFEELAAGEIGPADLARGALLIALEDYPHIDVDDYMAGLDELAERIRRRAAPGEPPVFLLGHLHAELFDVDGYRGDVDNYYDPRNAYLNEVIDRRTGIPITLSIIFLDVARRLGLNAFGVGLPGHYVVKVQFELNEVYVDPFHEGATLSMSELAELVGGVSGGRVRLSSEHLRSWAPRQTLMRVLANLQGMWSRAGDARRAASARERMDILQAGDVPTA